MSAGSEVAVVGGGVIGSSVARALALEGVEVLLVDGGQGRRSATWASAGMLSPLGEGLEEGPFLDMGLASLRLYPEFVRSLEEETGRDLQYSHSGKLHVALDVEEERALRARGEWGRERGFEMSWLGPGELGDRLPGVHGRARGGLLIAEDRQIENRTLGEALREAARRAGARSEVGRTVTRVVREGDRVRGLELDDGTFLPSERVVVAGGAWSGRIGGLPRPLPVRPVRGQMAALGPDDPPGKFIAASARVYLVPRRDGRILVGATMEEAGFDERTTADGILRMLRGAVELLPPLGNASVEEVWAGLRPATPDGLPILGPDPELEGLFYATGHFRNGILLAPLTGNLLRDLVLGGASPASVQPFLPDRFRPRRARSTL